MSGEVTRPGIGDSLSRHERRIRALERTRPAGLGIFGAANYPDGVHSISDLVAYWPLTDGATPYADLGGLIPPAPMALAGSGVAMTQDYTPGPLLVSDGGAVKFNGGASAGEYLRGTGAAASGGRFNSIPEMSAAAWVYPVADAGTFYGGVVGSTNAGISNASGWGLYMSWPSREMFWFRREDSSFGGLNLSGGVLPAATWTHVVATYSSLDGGPAKLYYNGLLVASTMTGVPNGGNSSNDQPQIGHGFAPSRSDEYFHGGVAHVALWSKRLSDADAMFLYLSGGYAPGAGVTIVSDGTGGFVYAPPMRVYVNGV